MEVKDQFLKGLEALYKLPEDRWNGLFFWFEEDPPKNFNLEKCLDDIFLNPTYDKVVNDICWADMDSCLPSDSRLFSVAMESWLWRLDEGAAAEDAYENKNPALVDPLIQAIHTFRLPPTSVEEFL